MVEGGMRKYIGAGWIRWNCAIFVGAMLPHILKLTR